MDLKENIDIDLVFICSQSARNHNEFNNKDSNLIFQSYFWEGIFRIWIKIIINENIPLKCNTSIANKKNFSLSFHIIDNEEISVLNQKWLNNSAATDVISFPIILDNEFANDLLFIELGDLFISLEMASNQAAKYKNTLKREIIWLASHGFLHLLGWEHKNDSQLKSMLNFQEYLISKLNLE